MLINVDVCYRDDFPEIEGFGTYEAQPVMDDAESTEGQEADQVEVAGRAFIAAHLHMQTPGETGMTIGKTRGALKGMWMDMVPKFHDGSLRNQSAAENVPGKGFGGGPGPVGRPKGGSFEDKRQDDADVGGASGQGSGLAREVYRDQGRKGDGECYRHGPFLAEMLLGQNLRMRRGMGGVTAVTAVMPLEDEEDDADLADDVYAFIRRTPLPWTHARIMQVALAEFRGVEREMLRATVAGVLAGMKKTPQHILMASIRNGTPHRGGRAATIYLDTDTVDIYL